MPKGRARANGEGSLFHRKSDDRWVAELIVGIDENGKKKVLRTAAATRKEVQTWLTARLNEKNNGLLVAPSKQPLGHYLEYWLATVVDHSVKRTTAAAYRQTIRHNVIPTLGEIPLGKLSPQHVQALYHQRIKAGQSNRTVHTTHAVLHKALDHAKKQGMVQLNVTDHVEAPRPVKKEMQTLTPEQARRFLEAARTDRLFPLYAVALQLGLRIGEILGLRWQDVDFTRETISIRQTYTNVGGHMEFGTPKTATSRRTIDTPRSLAHTLSRWEVDQGKEREMIGEGWKHPELIFTTTIGTPINPANIRNRSLLPLLNQAGCPRIRIHDLRHTALSLMGEMGIHPKVVQETAGHSDISVTLGTYSHIFREQKRAAAQKVDTFWTTADIKAR